MNKGFIGKRLKLLREEVNLTQMQLAKLFNLSDAAINRYEKGINDPDTETVKKLASYFNVSADYLLGLTDTRSQIDLPSNAIITNDYITVPLIGVIRAGEPIYAEQNILGYFSLPKMFVSSGEYFYLKVVGDSMDMEGIYEDGYVLVRRQDEIENGEIAVVIVNGDEATVKKFYKTDNQVTLIPRSTNPIHQPIVIDLKNTQLKVIGKVVYTMNKK